MAKEQKMTYKDAQNQLEIILEKLDSGQADVDELSILVKEASALLKLCKEKLQNAELDVLKVLLMQERRTNRLLVGTLLFAGVFLAGILIIGLGLH
jgi:exodeoxyribonuclease VII small subunit